MSAPFYADVLKPFKTSTSEKQFKKIPLVTTFSSSSSFLNHKWKNYFNQILKTTHYITVTDMISAYRQNNNLSNWLIRSQISNIKWSKPTNSTRYFLNLPFFRNSSNQLFKTIGVFNLKTSNCVYIVICRKCQKNIETKNELY